MEIMSYHQDFGPGDVGLAALTFLNVYHYLYACLADSCITSCIISQHHHITSHRVCQRKLHSEITVTQILQIVIVRHDSLQLCQDALVPWIWNYHFSMSHSSLLHIEYHLGSPLLRSVERVATKGLDSMVRSHHVERESGMHIWLLDVLQVT